MPEHFDPFGGDGPDDPSGHDPGGHDPAAHDRGGHDPGAHDPGAHDADAHDPFLHEPLAPVEHPGGGEIEDGRDALDPDLTDAAVLAHEIFGGPGGTVLDQPPDPEVAHSEPWDHPFAVAPEHYADGWAHDDGTGAIDGLAASDDFAATDQSSSTFDDGPPLAGHVADVAYGGADGIGETASLLWRELGPPKDPPIEADGAPLAPAELLTRLAATVEDPAARSVVDAALAAARAAR